MDDLRLLPCPPALRTRATEIIDGHAADPPTVAGATLASLLPDGLVPGTGWPRGGDLVGLASSPESRLVALGDEVIGGCGPVGTPEDGVQEIGYGFPVAYQGRGIGTASVRLYVAELFATGGLTAISAYMLEGNVASWRLVERLGFQQTESDVPGHRRYVLAGPDGAATSPA